MSTESDLTIQARAVLAGLSAFMINVLTCYAEGEADIDDEDIDTLAELRESGCFASEDGDRGNPVHFITPLGREVARLIEEEST
jgi:hypothetical protein